MKKENNGLGIASLVLGICSIVFSWVFYLGIPCGIVGIVLGVKQKRTSPNKLATAGLILSIIGLVCAVLWVLVVLLIFGVMLAAFGSAMNGVA